MKALFQLFSSFMFLISVFLISCVSNNKYVAPPPSSDVIASAIDVFQRQVDDSIVKTITPSLEKGWYGSSFGWREMNDNALIISISSTSEFGSGRHSANVGFELGSIPKEGFIVSAKMYFYVLKTKFGYDESLGFVQFVEPSNSNNIYNFDIDFKGGWYEVDLTEMISRYISHDKTYLEFYVQMEKDYLSADGNRIVFFAKSTTGTHVSPKIIVEYTN